MKMVPGLVKKDSRSVTLFNQGIAGYQSGISARIGRTIESPGPDGIEAGINDLNAIENPVCRVGYI